MILKAGGPHAWAIGKILFTLTYLLLPASAPAAPKRYLSATYGFASVPEEESNMSQLSGSALALALGQRTSKNLALEVLGQYLSFGEKTKTEGGVSTVTSQTKYFLAGGARFFLGKYVNAHAGLGAGRTVVESGEAGAENPASPVGARFSLVFYYGGGLQYPLGESAELMADYTKVGSGMNVTEINLGLRFRF